MRLYEGGPINPRIPARYRPKPKPRPRPGPTTRIVLPPPRPARPKLPVARPQPGLGSIGGILRNVRPPVPSPPPAPPKPKLPVSPYANPFAASGKVVGQRIDQGVDYYGQVGKPIGAVGPGKIVSSTTSSGWPGGGFIGEQLGAGPAKGQTVFVAEDVRPAVTQGQTVKAGQTIGYFAPGGSIETGYAAPGSDQALAYVKGQSNYSGDPGAYSTGYGIAYNKLLTALGAPSGVLQSTISGTAPPKFSSTGGRVVGVKPTAAPVIPPGAFTPTPAPVAGSVPIFSATPRRAIGGQGEPGGMPGSLRRTVKDLIPPTRSPLSPPPSLGSPGGVSISSGSLSGNVTGNGLPGIRAITQGPATPAGSAAPSIGAFVLGAAALGGIIYLIAKRNA